MSDTPYFQPNWERKFLEENKESFRPSKLTTLSLITQFPSSSTPPKMSAPSNGHVGATGNEGREVMSALLGTLAFEDVD